MMFNFTYQTPRCPRMFASTPWSGCTCIDCRAIYAYRWIRRKLGLMPKPPQSSGGS